MEQKRSEQVFVPDLGSEIGHIGSKTVVVERTDVSHIHHVPLKLIRVVFSSLIVADEPSEKALIVTHDFGQIVGKRGCIETRPGDSVFWQRRLGRLGHSRFIENGKKEPETRVTIVVRWLKEYQKWLLLTAYFGLPAPPEPWDWRAFRADHRRLVEQLEAALASWNFWSTHALVPGEDRVVRGTKTYTCPWTPPQ